MTTYYCVDIGTETDPNPWDPFKKGDPCVGHALLVNATDDLVFYGLNSCLGIMLLLSDGRRLAGHVVSIDMRNPTFEAPANAQVVLGEMLHLKPANVSIKKALFIYNCNDWNMYALLGTLGHPDYLGISYFQDRSGKPAMKPIDAKVMPEAITVKERAGGEDWTVTRWFSQSGGIDFQ